MLAASIFCILLIFSTLQACKYDNEAELYPNPPVCDTIQMTYSTDILPILQTHCYGCHSVGSNISGHPFDDYNIIKNYALIGKLVARTNDTLKPMPQPQAGGLLDECLRLKIKAWANRGAPF